MLLEGYDASKLYRVFRNLARRASDPAEAGDLMTYLAEVTKRQQTAKFSRLFKYIGVKPSAFGVTIDVSALLGDMASSDATAPRTRSGPG